MSKLTQGTKYDEGKPRYDLIPPEALEELAKLYTFGARKYADRNWEKGLTFSRVFAAMQRHAWTWMRGESKDREHRLSHMTSVAWCAFALVTMEKRGMVKFDDRPSKVRPRRARTQHRPSTLIEVAVPLSKAELQSLFPEQK